LIISTEDRRITGEWWIMCQICPGHEDYGTFSEYNRNIIIGPLGSPSVYKNVDASNLIIRPRTGAVIYYRNTKALTSITRSAIIKIIK